MTEEEKYKIILETGVGRTALPDEKELIAKAVRKQISWKPIIHESGIADLCPVCSKNGINMLALTTTKYCPQCGQKFDWSE